MGSVGVDRAIVGPAATQAWTFLWKNRQHGLKLLPRGFLVLSEDTSTPVLAEAGVAKGAPDGERADLRPESIQDAVIRLAGNSQDGIQTAGAFLARLAGRSEHDVMTYMTIPATISGGPSIFQVRIGSGEVLSAGDEADFLVAFYQHSYKTTSDSCARAAFCFTTRTTSNRTSTTSVSFMSACRSLVSRSKLSAARPGTRAKTFSFSV